MPAKNPRFNITVSRELHAVIVRLAELQGVSRSKVIYEILEGVVPVLQETAVTLEHAARIKGTPQARAIARALDKLGRLEGVTQEALGQYRLFNEQLATVARSQADVRPPRRKSVRAGPRAKPK